MRLEFAKAPRWGNDIDEVDELAAKAFKPLADDLVRNIDVAVPPSIIVVWYYDDASECDKSAKLEHVEINAAQFIHQLDLREHKGCEEQNQDVHVYPERMRN